MTISETEPVAHCKECGKPLSTPDNPAIRRKKKFCSADCRAATYYRENHVRIRSDRNDRYNSDPEYRKAEIIRCVETKQRRRQNKI